MNVSISQILSGTPIWVFALFAFLIWTGARRLKAGVREFAKIWITPGIFIVWGLIGLFQQPGDFSDVLFHWAIGAVLGAALGLAFGIPLQADHTRRLVLLPGSVLPLLRILIIFGAHYVLRVAGAIPATPAASTISSTRASARPRWRSAPTLVYRSEFPAGPIEITAATVRRFA